MVQCHKLRRREASFYRSSLGNRRGNSPRPLAFEMVLRRATGGSLCCKQSDLSALGFSIGRHSDRYYPRVSDGPGIQQSDLCCKRSPSRNCQWAPLFGFFVLISQNGRSSKVIDSWCIQSWGLHYFPEIWQKDEIQKSYYHHPGMLK